MTPLKYVFNYALSLALGGLSGVRAFLPLFVLSCVALEYPSWVELSPSMEWVRHPASAVCMGSLTLAESVATMIPIVDNAVNGAMTFVHPIMGFVTALAPNLGSTSTYSQGPMAVVGGAQAFALHLLKLLVRLGGCGCLGPCVAAVETLGSLVLVPLVVCFGAVAVLVAALLLVVVARFAYRSAVATQEFAIDLAGGDPAKQAAITNYVRREHSVLSIYYIKHEHGMRRSCRVALLGTTLTWQLWLCVKFLDSLAREDQVVQNVLVVACLAPVRAVSYALVKTATSCDRPALPGTGAPQIGPKALAVLAALEALALYWTWTEIQRRASRDDVAHVVVNWLNCVLFSFILELAQHVLTHAFCGCCPCVVDDAIFDPPPGAPPCQITMPRAPPAIAVPQAAAVYPPPPPPEAAVLHVDPPTPAAAPVPMV